MFQKEKIIERVATLPFGPKDYCVITGTALVMHGVKVETKDIDISCSKRAFQILQDQGFLVKQGAYARKIIYDEDIEIFEEWHKGAVTMIDGISVASLESVIQMKNQLGREKDQWDVARIQRFLSGEKKTLSS